MNDNNNKNCKLCENKPTWLGFDYCKVCIFLERKRLTTPDKPRSYGICKNCNSFKNPSLIDNQCELCIAKEVFRRLNERFKITTNN